MFEHYFCILRLMTELLIYIAIHTPWGNCCFSPCLPTQHWPKVGDVLFFKLWRKDCLSRICLNELYNWMILLYNHAIGLSLWSFFSQLRTSLGANSIFSYLCLIRVHLIIPPTLPPNVTKLRLYISPDASQYWFGGRGWGSLESSMLCVISLEK